MNPEHPNPPRRRKRKLTEAEKRRRARIRKKRLQMRRRRQMLQAGTVAVLVLIVFLLSRGKPAVNPAEIQTESALKESEFSASDSVRKDISFALPSKDGLKGTWDYDGNTMYYFDGQGKGQMQLPLSSYDFTYSTENGMLHIDFADPDVQDSDYSFSTVKDTLTLISDKALVFHKKKD